MKRVSVTLALLFTVAVAVVLAQYSTIISSGTLPTCGATPGLYIKTGTSPGLYVCQGGSWTGPMSTSVSSGTNTGDVTLAGAPTYLTIAGQVITRALIDLATHVTGDLPYANLTPSSNGSRLLGRTDASAGDWQEIALGTNLSLSGTTLNATGGGGGGSTDYHVAAQFGDGISAITTGWKGCSQIPHAGTITAVTMVASDAATPTTGSLVVDLWKDTYANFPPTDADSITSSTPPTISASDKSLNTTLTSWTTAVTAGDFICYYVDSAATITKANLWIRIHP